MLFPNGEKFHHQSGTNAAAKVPYIHVNQIMLSEKGGNRMIIEAKQVSYGMLTLVSTGAVYCIMLKGIVFRGPYPELKDALIEYNNLR